MSAPAAGEVLIRCTGLRKVFPAAGRMPEVVALAGVTVAIHRDEIVVVLGPSGCGKTTLLNLVAGFERPTSGTILVEGRPVTRPGPDRGMVFQDYGLFPWLTVGQNVEFGLRAAGAPRRERLRRTRDLVELVGLEGFERSYPHELSGGMRQRVALARVLAIRPKTLLMDEPFAAVDAQTRSLLQQELLGLWERDRRTVLFVTHNVDEAVLLAHRVVVLTARPGTVREIVPVDLPFPRDVTDDAFNRYRRRLILAVEAEVGGALRRQEPLPKKPSSGSRPVAAR